MCAVIFFAFSTHHPQSTTRAVRMCSAPRRRVRDVTRTRVGVTDITLWVIPRGAGSYFCAASCRPSQRKRSKSWGRWNIVGPYVSYGLFQNTGETCAKFGSDRFRNVDLYKAQTNKHTYIQTNKHSSLYIRLLDLVSNNRLFKLTYEQDLRSITLSA